MTMQGAGSLPRHLQYRLWAELRWGESLVWAGQPDPARIMRSAAKSANFVGSIALTCVFSIAIATDSRGSTWDSDSRLLEFGLFFLIVVLGGIVSLLWQGRKARATLYAITSRRALVIVDTGSVEVMSYAPSDLVVIRRTVYPDGTGDLILKSEDYVDGDGVRETRCEGFFAIRDVRRVEQLFETLRTMNA